MPAKFKNLAYSLVATAPSPATSGTSLVVTAAEGARFPVVATVGSFLATLCPPGEIPHAGNSEIVLVTARSTDTFTVTRAQGGSSAKSVAIGWQIFMGIYADDIVDEDNMASNSDDMIPTQQSVKAYVDGLAPGWVPYAAVVPTTGTFDAPSYPIVFAGVDLTGVIFPGMRVRITQSTVKYFIVTKVEFSTDTTVTLYGGTDYSLVASGTTAISAFAYSGSYSPPGFNPSKAKWTQSATDTSSRTQSSPVQNTWYNLGSLTLAVPIGVWELSYDLEAAIAGSKFLQTTLSTANNSNSDNDFATRYYTTDATFTIFKKKIVPLTSKTSYFLNTRTTSASTSQFWNDNDVIPAYIRAICAYV